MVLVTTAIFKSLQAYLNGKSHRKHHAVFVGSLRGDIHSAADKEQEQDYYHKRAHKAKLLADYGKNKVVFCLGQI